MTALDNMKCELCIGLLEEEVPVSHRTAATQRVEQAGFGHFDATAALERCNGDADKALTLLASGWRPLESPPPPTDSGSSAASRCPFLSGSMHSSHPCQQA